MHSFTDNEGRTWTLSLTFGSAKRVRSLLGDDVDLLALTDGDPPLLTRLATEVMLLCDVIFALLKPQADEQDVTDEEWAEAMGGEAITAAQEALYAEIKNFFRGRGREDVAKAAEKQEAMIRKAVQAVETRLDRVDPAKEINQIFGDSDTGSPESAE